MYENLQPKYKIILRALLKIAALYCTYNASITVEYSV
jgi:hypothetical protein